jgi:hypothetical protein
MLHSTQYHYLHTTTIKESRRNFLVYLLYLLSLSCARRINLLLHRYSLILTPV